MQAAHTLKLIRLTEKATKLSSELGQYTFEVATDATKQAIARAVEETFKVTVRRVNTITCAGKNKRGRSGLPSMTSEFKKAIVTLKAGDKIEIV